MRVLKQDAYMLRPFLFNGGDYFKKQSGCQEKIRACPGGGGVL
jgi:hypothetical protein